MILNDIICDMVMRERAWQFGLGGEFGGDKVSSLATKALEVIPALENYYPVAMVDLSGCSKKGLAFRIYGKGRQREILFFPNLNTLVDYCSQNKVRGLILLTGRNFDNFFVEQEKLDKVFSQFEEKKESERYRVWLVDEELAGIPCEPKDDKQREFLDEKRGFLKVLGLVGVKYHHDARRNVGWFEGRPRKKREVKEKDLTDDPRIKFLKKWAEAVAGFRGARVLDDSSLRENLAHSSSYVNAMKQASDLEGVVLEYNCGCRVKLEKGAEVVLYSCGEENCLRGNVKSELPIVLGEEVPMENPCADCGEPRTVTAYWYNLGTRKLYYEVKCQGFSSHGYKGQKEGIDPARIINPLYLYSSKLNRKGNASRKRK